MESQISRLDKAHISLTSTHPPTTTPPPSQVERRLSSGAEGDDEGDTAARPAATSQPTTPLLSGLGDGPSEAATPASFPPSSSSSPPTPLTAATGEAFFADAMRRAVAAKQWEIATQLHALALGCGAVTAVGPVGEGDEVVVSSAGPSRRLDLYMYGGALAAARARGQGKDERALVEVRLRLRLRFVLCVLCVPLFSIAASGIRMQPNSTTRHCSTRHFSGHRRRRHRARPGPGRIPRHARGLRPQRRLGTLDGVFLFHASGSAFAPAAAAWGGTRGKGREGGRRWWEGGKWAVAEGGGAGKGAPGSEGGWAGGE